MDFPNSIFQYVLLVIADSVVILSQSAIHPQFRIYKYSVITQNISMVSTFYG